MKFMKFSFALVAVFLFALLTGGSVAAFSPSPTPVAEVNSFELFWPLSPGKVMGDPVYPLKSLKEKFRGVFIFGATQKVDYEVFLATKRIIETEKLLNENKDELALKTLDVFLGKLDLSISEWDKAKMAGNTPVATKDNVRKQLNNIETFLKYLSSKNSGDIKEKIDQGLDKTMKLQNSL